MTHVADLVAAGTAALDAGRWDDARKAFEASLVEGETAHGHLGLARALWWRGDNQNSVDHCTAAYSLFRRAGDVAGAVECALWLAITYKANFANFAAANGWIARAERLLEPIETGPPHAWAWVTRAYRMTDLDGAATLTQQALDLARVVGDVDLELIATSQLGLILVGQGDTAEGFALIDEAMAAALGGEPSDLVTVVYTCCDMLNACELVNDAERAAQWCQVADQFVERYGCPFLYAECRIYYGSVLTATGRWSEAEQQLDVGVQNTAGACPGLHRKALTRLANLRIRQGRLEEADQLLDEVGVSADAESDVTLSAAALSLARGDGPGARRLLEHRWRSMERHRAHLVVALDLLVDAHLAIGDVDAAATSATHLADVAAPGDSRLGAVAVAAAGRVAGGPRRRADGGRPPRGGGRPAGRPRTCRSRRRGRSSSSVASSPAVSRTWRSAMRGGRWPASSNSGRRSTPTVWPPSCARWECRREPDPKGVGALTTREQEVLALIARGLSNPEIAERLYVSRKTAAHHVSRILSKLNLRNRAAAAAFATGAGALDCSTRGLIVGRRSPNGSIARCATIRARSHARYMTTPTGPVESFQLPIEAAELYESAFVPAFFAQWAPILCEVAGVAPPRSVLDVACGTGIVARTAAELLGPDGTVVGVDINEAMLAVAGRVRPDIDWRQGDATMLPFADESFDTVLCQMAMMFFADRRAAVSEMARVATSDGTVAVVVPAALETQAAFRPFVELATRVAGPEAKSLLTTYFVCGDLGELTALFEDAGLRVTVRRSVTGTYGAPSVDAAVTTEVESTPLIDRISEATYRRLRDEAVAVLAPFTEPDGRLVAPFECLVVAASRR